MARPPFIVCFQYIGLQKREGPPGKLDFTEVFINLYHYTSPIIIAQGS